MCVCVCVCVFRNKGAVTDFFITGGGNFTCFKNSSMGEHIMTSKENDGGITMTDETFRFWNFRGESISKTYVFHWPFFHACLLLLSFVKYFMPS